MIWVSAIGKRTATDQRAWRGTLAAVLVGLFLLSLPRMAAAEQPTSGAYLVDATTDTLLVRRNADVPFAPASLAKLMTAAVVFAAVAQKEITLETTYEVSEHAWRTGGAPARTTTMFAALGSKVSVGDLLRGLIIQHANDAAIVLAEGLSGSEAAFAERMNAYAAEIGLTESRFVNPTGFEAPGAVTSAADMARLANHIIEQFPQFYPLFSAPDFTWNGIFQRNKNPLLGAVRGLDGLMTGYSEAHGYSAVGSAVRSGRRFIGVVTSLKSDTARAAALADLFDGVERDFEELELFPSGATIAEARVFGGTQSYVPLQASGAVKVLLPRGDRQNYRLRVTYRGPIIAPVEAGLEVGELRILHEDAVAYRTTLVTAAAVERGTMTGRALDAVTETLFGWLP